MVELEATIECVTSQEKVDMNAMCDPDNCRPACTPNFECWP